MFATAERPYFSSSTSSSPMHGAGSGNGGGIGGGASNSSAGGGGGSGSYSFAFSGAFASPPFSSSSSSPGYGPSYNPIPGHFSPPLPPLSGSPPLSSRLPPAVHGASPPHPHSHSHSLSPGSSHSSPPPSMPMPPLTPLGGGGGGGGPHSHHHPHTHHHQQHQHPHHHHSMSPGPTGVGSGGGSGGPASAPGSPAMHPHPHPHPHLHHPGLHSHAGSLPGSPMGAGAGGGGGGSGGGGGHTHKGTDVLQDMEDPQYYCMPSHKPERQVVVLTSRIKERVHAIEKTRWLDQQLSYRQCPYPIQHIEFTHAGDAVVQFISEEAMTKALGRPPLMWGPQEIGTRACTEDDIAALFWVGVLGARSEQLPHVRQALAAFGEVRGEYAPHPSTVDPSLLAVAGVSSGGSGGNSGLGASELNGSAPEFVPGLGLRGDGSGAGSGGMAAGLAAGLAGGGGGGGVGQLHGGSGSGGGAPLGGRVMLKLYFAPSGRRRLPPTIHIPRIDRPKNYPPQVARLFTPVGPLAPKCSDFGPNHSAIGCPECYRRRHWGA